MLEVINEVGVGFEACHYYPGWLSGWIKLKLMLISTQVESRVYKIMMGLCFEEKNLFFDNLKS